MNELVQRLRMAADLLNIFGPDSVGISCIEAAALIEQQAGAIERLKKDNADLRTLSGLNWTKAEQFRLIGHRMADALEHFGGDPIADEPLGKWKELNK